MVARKERKHCCVLQLDPAILTGSAQSKLISILSYTASQRLHTSVAPAYMFSHVDHCARAPFGDCLLVQLFIRMFSTRLIHWLLAE